MGYKDLVSNKVAAAIARATATNTQTAKITLPNKTLGSEQKSVNWRRSSPFPVVGPPQSKLPPLPLFIVKGTSVSPLPDPHFELLVTFTCHILFSVRLFCYTIYFHIFLLFYPVFISKHLIAPFWEFSVTITSLF